ncbi:MAG: tRNA pseudouridine(38-40) synthase TruA, partial [Bacilli bacterium]
NADGFLYHMIRLIMGVLVAIGLKQYPPSIIKTILESEQGINNLMSLPAQGLCLTKINY